MARTPEDSDPAPVRTSGRAHAPSNRLTDPMNSAPLDAAHQAAVAKSITTIVDLIKQIKVLSNTLPDSVAVATRDGRIAEVINKIKGLDTGGGAKSSTFVRRMDLLFGSTVRDDDGRMTLIRRGGWGMKLVVQYFESIDWEFDGIPLAVATLKLTQVVEELQFICSNPPITSQHIAPEALAAEEPSQSSSPTKSRSPSADYVHSDSDFEPYPTVDPASNRKITVSSATGPNRGRSEKKKRRKREHSKSPDEVNANGILKDIPVGDEVQTDDGTENVKRGRDIDNFFYAAHDNKRTCKPCEKSHAPKMEYVNHATTLRRHLERYHKPAYLVWMKANDFESMLPLDTAERRKLADVERASQSTLDGHLGPRPEPSKVLKYTPERFSDAAIKWIVATDQPLSAMSNKWFQEMIDIASRATEGVDIPTRKAVRKAILRLFKANLLKLKALLNSMNVPGLLQLAVDAWQADNTDAYFVATGSFIDISGGVWRKRTVVLGFVRLQNSHNGKRLGQTLYQILVRIGAAHKAGRVTCDNATNNNTMMTEFAFLIRRNTSHAYDAKEQRLRCLAHIVNLATQAVIKTYSKSKCYNPHAPEEHVPDLTSGPSRDVVGLVRAIAVKERSSAKRKELFRVIQKKADSEHVLQLILDMVIRWSSTYAMLHRGYTLRQHVDTFIKKIARDEKDNEKSEKLAALALTSDEWGRVKSFVAILGLADAAQQAFSSDEGPSMHSAIPALEALHRNWELQTKKVARLEFKPALDAGLAKIDEYYNKITDSDAYIFCMILDPSQKTAYFAEHWSADLQSQVLVTVEKIFESRWLELREAGTDSAPPPRKKTKLSGLLAVNFDSDDDDADTPAPAATFATTEPGKPWYSDFRKYMDTVDEVPEDMSLVTWWGINHPRFHPAWKSLALDYLAIQAASVSAERAFSSGGITISKRRNRLKGDIVEALQFLKSSLRSEILFPDMPYSSNEPLLSDDAVVDGAQDDDDEAEFEGLGIWDQCLCDEPDDGEDDDDLSLYD